MEKQFLSTDLVIHPEYFSSELLHSNILEQLKNIEVTCSFQYGYIDQIYRIIDITGTKLLDNGLCKINIFFEANCFKPEIGKEIDTTVQMIFQHGIFSSFYILRFLIPSSQLSEYNFISDISVYEHKITKKQIKIGDTIRIQILNLKFEKDHFSCISKLI